MAVVALLALLLLSLVALGALAGAHHALRSRATVAADADPVTGLPGRPRFRADLDARLAGGGPTTLLLARLDGFAAYDAAFGHRAGDALLVRLADELRRAVRDEATAYRPGGTTFCALTADDVLSIDALERRVTAALREEGNGFAVAASVGRVTIPREAASSAEALRLADARADLARRAADPKPRDASPTAALADALALTGDHALGAAELAEAVAKRMGLERTRAGSRPAGLSAQRAGQARPPRHAAGQGRRADRRGARLRARPPGHRRAHPPARPRPRGRRGARALQPRTLRRQRAPRRPGRRGDPARRAHRRGLRRLRRDAFAPPVAPGDGTEAALAELRRGAGSQFDAAVVDAFDAVIDERSRLFA